MTRTLRRIAAIAIAIASLTLLASPAAAVNKCTGPDGRISFQDAPCGNESKKSEALKVWGGNQLQSQPVRGSGPVTIDPDLALKASPQAAPLLQFYRRWADGEKLAMVTSRIALAQPVANLQAVQRELENHAAPECLQPAKTALLSLVSGNVKIMIDFMNKQESSGIVYQYLDRTKMIRAFESAVTSARCE